MGNELDLTKILFKHAEHWEGDKQTELIIDFVNPIKINGYALYTGEIDENDNPETKRLYAGMDPGSIHLFGSNNKKQWVSIGGQSSLPITGHSKMGGRNRIPAENPKINLPIRSKTKKDCYQPLYYKVELSFNNRIRYNKIKPIFKLLDGTWKEPTSEK